MADHGIAVSGWQEAWLERSDPNLFYYCAGFFFILAGISIILSIRSLLTLRRCRKEILQDISSRTAIFTACNKRMLKFTRTQFHVAGAFCSNTLFIWLVDAGISLFAVWNDVDANPEAYTAELWLALAISVVSMLAIFIFVFLVFPMMQLMLFSWAFAKYRSNKNNPDGTLAPFIPELRALSTQMAQFWMMLGFLLMAFWPVYYKSPVRLTIAEAIYGSGLAWSHVSMMLNWRSEEIANIEIKPRMSAKDAVLLYGQHGIALPLKKAKETILPRYDEEKQALLAGTQA